MTVRRKVLTAKQRALRDYKVGAVHSIGRTREDQEVIDHLIEAAVITAVRAYIWATRPSCQLCRGSRRPGHPDAMHEDPSRAQTRGQPPEQRFNLVVCGRLCVRCHADVTEGRLSIVFLDPALGFLGRITARKDVPDADF